MVEAHPLVLRLRSAGLKDLDPCNIDEVHNMWNAFSKAKMCIDGGDRLEYLSWRIYSREVLAIHASRQSNGTPGTIDPKPADVAAVESESENASSGSEDEWLSDTDGSATSESDDDEVPALVKSGDNSASKPKKDAASSQATPIPSLDSCHRMHRKISSIELQHLFSESRSPVRADPKQQSTELNGSEQRSMQNSAKPIPTNTVPGGAQHAQHGDGTAMKSCLKKSSSVSPEPTGSVHRARFASPQPVPQHEPYRSSNSRVHDKTASPVVRGFSPSSISVSVGKQGFDESMIRKNSSNSESDLSPLEKDTSAGSQTSATNGKKMFYIGAADSDTDSSTTGSPEQRSRTTTENTEEAKTEAGDGAVSDKPGDGRPIKTGSAPVGSADTSDWDDTSDEEEDEDDETANEERQKEMFKERAVPKKPLLKRSLLSSLFVNRINDPPPQAEKPKIEVNSPENRVSAPVDILLGAPLAPHFPLPGQAKVDANAVDWSSAVSNGTELAPQPYETQPRHRNSSTGRSFSESSLHITTRPEMYRASTDTRVHRRSSNDIGDQNNWAHQHEDIYDPMNYHSRGW